MSDFKEKFSQDALLENRDRADRYEEIQERQRSINESYIKLKSGFENELDNIAKEISNLEYRRDKSLVREFEDREYNQRQLLQAELNESIEKQNLIFSDMQEKTLLDEKELRDENGVFEKEIQAKQSLLTNRQEESHREKKRVRESYEREQEKYKAESKRKDSLVEDKYRVIKNLKFDSEDLAE
ncbi:MAG: hypothetical protein Q9M40_05560 [Sulfurimonas sp.]|nr:hypothetical protein [Sulfurimonas sp.]